MPAGWVSAGIAAVGTVENIQNNNKQQEAAKNANAGHDQAVASAEAINNTPFTPYGGTLTAGPDQNENMGESMARSAADPNGPAAQDYAKATGAIDSVAGSKWNTDTAKQYMNPYQEDVNKAAIEESNRTYQKNVSDAGLRAAGPGGSAFGGDREAILESELGSANQRNNAQITATGNAAAYDTALKTWQGDRDTQLRAASAYDQMGGDVTRMNTQQIQDLMKTGGTQRLIAQTGPHAAYSQFMRHQNWATDRLQPLLSLTGKNGMTPVPASNVGNQLLGLGSTIAGIWGGSAGNGLSSADNASINNTGRDPNYIPAAQPVDAISGDAAPAAVD